MDRRATPPKPVTSSTWGPPPPCKQALSLRSRRDHSRNVQRMRMRHIFWAARLAASRRQNLHARKNKRLFSLFVLFSHFRQHNDAPDNFFFQMLSYARESTCICMHNYWNSLENIPWSELGKQSIQAKKVYSASYAGYTLVGWSLIYLLYKVSLFFPSYVFFFSFFFLMFSCRRGISIRYRSYWTWLWCQTWSLCCWESNKSKVSSLLHRNFPSFVNQ